MEIKITRTANNLLYDQHKALWQLIQDNRPASQVIVPILYLILGVIFIVLCFATSKMGEPFWKPETTAGIVLVLYSLAIYYSNYSRKKLFMKRTKIIVEEYEKNNNVTEITLTESIIQIRDFQVYYESKWSTFKNIQISKDYFFIMADEYYQNGFVINKNEMAANDAQELTNFIMQLNLSKI